MYKSNYLFSYSITYDKKKSRSNHGSKFSNAGTSMIERPSNSSKSTFKIPDLSP